MISYMIRFAQKIKRSAAICEAGDSIDVGFVSNRRKGNYEYNI